jgi:hypothetical protein
VSLSLSLTVSDHTIWLCYHLPGLTQLDCTALCASNHALYSLALALTHLYHSPVPLQTRSGKIMRRILRKIAAGEEDSIGDITTLADPSVRRHTRCV